MKWPFGRVVFVFGNANFRNMGQAVTSQKGQAVILNN